MRRMNEGGLRLPFLLAAAFLFAGSAAAGPLFERIVERRTEAVRQQPRDDIAVDDDGALVGVDGAIPGVRVLRDIAYGEHPLQRFDVYLPERGVTGAPVVLMAHGGAWAIGDKRMRTVVENKAARWVARGIVFISTNYRLLPDAAPLEQARDVARALAAAQGRAGEWGGDPRRFVLMGHSAGAHLVALLAAAPALVRDAGGGDWLGTVALDSAGFDIDRLMRERHARLYDRAFGDDPGYWRETSPLHRLHERGRPLLAVCSTRRQDHPCVQAHAFAAAARKVDMPVQVLEQPLSHRDINLRLGLDDAYTAAVEDFLGRLDVRFAATLPAR